LEEVFSRRWKCMREGEPPWYEDRVSISRKAERLQELIEEELERRASGIPREHWKWAGIKDEPYSKPDLKLVDAEYEVLEPAEPAPEKAPSSKMSWDFYFMLGITLLAGMMGSYLVVNWFLGVLRTWIY